MPADSSTPDDIAFARAQCADSSTVQVKLDLPKDIVTWLDVETFVRGQQWRGPLIVEILQKWADEQAHAHSPRLNVLRSKPPASDSVGQGGAA